MKIYEYDNNGWLIGWHTDANRPNSTSVEPVGIRPVRAKWNGSAWTEDGTRESLIIQQEQDLINARQAAINLIKNYNPSTATAAEVRATLGAVIEILKELRKDA